MGLTKRSSNSVVRQHWNASRKVIGSIFSTGKVFHYRILADYIRLFHMVNSIEIFFSMVNSMCGILYTIMSPAVQIRDGPELNKQKEPGVGLKRVMKLADIFVRYQFIRNKNFT